MFQKLTKSKLDWPIYYYQSINVGLLPFKKICFICFNGRSLQMMQNTFCFMLKGLFILDIFNFCTNFFVHVGKLVNDAMIYFKLYDVVDWQTSNYITHIAEYLRRKGNQTMNISWEIFSLKNNTKNVPATPLYFYKKWKLCIFLDQQSEMVYKSFFKKSKEVWN